ncbi:MAG: SPOR domain-containing protein [Candidatus Omnitrophica bacterium]|nr:SPOR domain-containing protein [Candidatus Omnitrophota bacterium]
MNNDNFQYDLFGGECDSKKEQKIRRREKYSKHRVIRYIRIPVEYGVMIAIGILVAIIIVYAVGVEKGKRFSGAVCSFLPESKEEDASLREKDMEAEETVIMSIQEEKQAEPEIVEKEEAFLEVEEVKKEKSLEEGVYEIPLASFRKAKAAETETAKLKKQGIEAKFSKKGIWYQVFAEGYKTIDDALAAKEKLSVDYKDCYVRRVQ